MSERPQEPMSIEQAANWLEEQKKKTPDASKAPISVADSASRRKYLKYCISLCPDKRSQIILTLIKIYGYNYTQIAIYLQHHGFGTTTEEDVKKVEKEAINRVKEAIARKRATAIPILGGMSA